MLVALTRPVSPSLARCELVHQARVPIDVGRAREQHAAYERALEELGVRLSRVPAAPELPDAVFVEDTALVLDELAVLTRPGAASRRKEVEAVRRVLLQFRPVHRLAAPALLDGGDVLRVGRTLFVGLSSRTNQEALVLLKELLAPHGYQVRPVGFQGCLHLKSAVTQVDPGLLLLNPAWVDPGWFSDCEVLTVDPSEPAAANALWVEGTVLYPAHHPRTADRLAARSLRLRSVDCDELAKAEGGVTCCSILFRNGAGAGA